MIRPRRFDESAVVERALNVFSEHGYDSASMSMLTAAMGVSAPSVYAAFGSKHGLFHAVLTRYDEQMARYREWVLRAPTALGVATRALLGAAGGQDGAPPAPNRLLLQGAFISLSDASATDALRERRAFNEDALAERFTVAHTSGDLPQTANPDALAGFVMTVIDGLMVRANSGGTTAELGNIARDALATFTTLVSPQIGELTATPIRATGRGRPREFLAGDALDRAVVVFWEKGFDGASLTDLTDAMGINRPSLYLAFGNKETLFLKAMERYEEITMAYAREALTAPTLAGVVQQLLDGAVARQLSDDSPRGCLWTINAQQGSVQAQRIREHVLGRMASGHADILRRARRAHDDNDFPASMDPEGFAHILTSVLQGITTLGAAGGTSEQLHALAHGARALLTPAAALTQAPADR